MPPKKSSNIIGPELFFALFCIFLLSYRYETTHKSRLLYNKHVGIKKILKKCIFGVQIAPQKIKQYYWLIPDPSNIIGLDAFCES